MVKKVFFHIKILCIFLKEWNTLFKCALYSCAAPFPSLAWPLSAHSLSNRPSVLPSSFSFFFLQLSFSIRSKRKRKKERTAEEKRAKRNRQKKSEEDLALALERRVNLGQQQQQQRHRPLQLVQEVHRHSVRVSN